MISHPVQYYRDFDHDLACIRSRGNYNLEKAKRIVSLALPFLGLSKTFRAPLNISLGCVRSVAYIKHLMQAGKKRLHKNKLNVLHAALSVGSVGMAFFKPSKGMILSSLSDFIANTKRSIFFLSHKAYKPGLESLASASMDLLWMLSIGYASIEITVASMILQALLSAYSAKKSFAYGDTLEGITKSILAAIQGGNAIPQIRVLEWKLNNQPNLQAELKQNSNGFVYLDVPDDYVKTLFPLCDSKKAILPPYFGADKVGAHISVIPAVESKNVDSRALIPELGKKIPFRIASLMSLKPKNWKDIDKVWFLTTVSSELEAFRSRMGLSPKIHDHDFHLTFGVLPHQT